MKFEGVRDADGATVYCDGRALMLPRLRESGWNAEARHSPTGFEWGYEGSGPAELARAVLMTVFPGDEVVRTSRCYQRFKVEVIAGLQREGFVLEAEAVRDWRRRWEAGERTS